MLALRSTRALVLRRGGHKVALVKKCTVTPKAGQQADGMRDLRFVLPLAAARLAELSRIVACCSILSAPKHE